MKSAAAPLTLLAFSTRGRQGQDDARALVAFKAIEPNRGVDAEAQRTRRHHPHKDSFIVKFDIRDKLVWHSILMVISMGSAMVLNILFQALVGRSLSPEEFSILASLLAVVNMTHMPMAAVSSGITHFVALEIQEGREGAIRRLFLRWVLKMAAIYAPMLAIGILGAGPIAGFFNLDREAPIIVMTLVAGGVLGSVVVNGILHGMQKFNWLLYTNLTLSVFRVIGAALFIFLVVPAAGWALLGHGVGLLAAVLLGLVGIYLATGQATPPEQKVRVTLRWYVAKSVGVLGAYALLMHGDIILVRHFLPAESGEFAYASTLGKIMVLICTPIAKSLFPKVVTSGTATNEHIRMIRKAILYSAMVAAVLALACTVLPGLPLRILYKMEAPDLHARMLVVAMAWTMIPVGLINLVINFQLAQRRFKETIPILAGAAAYAGCIFVWHESVWQIVIALAATATLTLLGLLFYLPKIADRPDQPETHPSTPPATS